MFFPAPETQLTVVMSWKVYILLVIEGNIVLACFSGEHFAVGCQKLSSSQEHFLERLTLVSPLHVLANLVQTCLEALAWCSELCRCWIIFPHFFWSSPCFILLLEVASITFQSALLPVRLRCIHYRCVSFNPTLPPAFFLHLCCTICLNTWWGKLYI